MPERGRHRSRIFSAAETVGPEIGPEISGDFPEVLAALAARAEVSPEAPDGCPSSVES